MAQWDQIEFVYPEHVPTMISKEERRYLYWLGAEQWTGAGEVVEMGPWLGGSTVCLAAGMVASGIAGSRRLHVFDSFVWRDFMSERSDLDLITGASFEPFFRANVKEFGDMIVVERAALDDEIVQNDSFAVANRKYDGLTLQPVSWTNGQPIEILFVDGAKSWSGFRHLLNAFGPFLIPGRSLIVLQDFKSWRSFWVPAIMELLAANLSFEHILRHDTVSFRVVKPIDRSVVDAIPKWPDISAEACEDLIDRAAKRLAKNSDRVAELVVRLSATRMWMHKGNPSQAVSRFCLSEQQWPLTASDGNLEAARTWLEDETGRTLTMTTRRAIRRGLNKAKSMLITVVRRLKHRNGRSLP